MVSFDKFKNAVIDFYRFKIDMPAQMIADTYKASSHEDAMMDARAIVVLVIGVYLASALLPSAISALNGANTSGWTATQTAIWGVVSVVILAVVIMKIAE